MRGQREVILPKGPKRHGGLAVSVTDGPRVCEFVMILGREEVDYRDTAASTIE